MRKRTVLGLFALLAVGMVVSTSLVSAYGPWGFGDDETHEEMRSAIESGDFGTWKELMQSQITEERFEQIQERQQNRFAMRESNEAIRAALDDGDYETWKELVSGLDHYPVDVETITEEDFDLLVQMHQARTNGDWETADELADELGWEQPGPMGMGKGAGLESGQGRGHGQGRMMESLGDCPFAE